MHRSCPNWAWALSDGRFKCRNCGNCYTVKSIWDSFRISNQAKKKLLECFVWGVPAYCLRFRGPASRPTIERFFRTIREVLSIAEECTEPFGGEIECDETTFGGKKPGKRGWGAAGKIIVLGIFQFYLA